KYIHRVICQSGVSATESFFQVQPEEKARKLARYFGYTGDSDQGVLGDCGEYRSDGVQKDFFSSRVSGSESCLYLNVYTPRLPGEADTTKGIPRLPVMVYIHGGGFMSGSGSSFFYNPEHFIQQEVLVVTVNYRLGPLGFLYLPSAGIPGNAGLKDQLLALRWVNENIAQFGGNPDNVTLFGESAGSMSAYLHYLSPNSRLGKRWKAFGKAPERFVPVLLGRSPELDRAAVGREIKQFYFGERPVNERTIDKMCDLLSDNTFITNSVTSAEWLAKYQPNAPHFHYRFTFDGRFSLLKRIFQLSNVPGACHGDDMMYMFNPNFLPKLPPSSDECRVRNIFIALWTSFAKHGDPTHAVPSSLIPVRWEPVSKVARDSDDFDLDCLEINTVPRMVRNPGAGRMQLWRGLLKKYRANYLQLVAVRGGGRLGQGVIAFLLHHLHMRWFAPRHCPLVTVRQGQLRGVESRLPNGARYYHFKGVPYAEAPVGALRFKAPVALERFRKPVLDCYAERSDFIQLDFFSGLVFGSERGLYLNVYTPQLPEEQGEEAPIKRDRLPVMVFLHGGGFACGSGSSLFYSPEYFLQRGVVVVTLNYRLGPFGFLYLPEAGVEGNAGLKDQLMALRWINENIANFSGDPQNVTLFGESAGSFSTYLHMLSPNSRKYFHRVICQSGVVCSSSFMQANPLEMAFNLARHFGYSGTSQQGALETLQRVPAKQLAKQQRKALGQNAEKQADLVFIFLPVVEQQLTEHSIITEPPEVLLKSYDTLRTPLLEGCNDAEGILGLYIIRRKTREDDIRHLPGRLAAKLFRHLDSSERAEVTDKIRKFYFSDDPPSAWSTDQIKHLLTDVIFMMDSAINAEWLAKYQPNLPHYHYRFTYDGRYSLLKRLFLSSSVSGACHGDDLMYMFKPTFLPNFTPDSDECRVRDNFVALWTSFAKHGDPSVDSRDVVDVQWRPVGKIPRDGSVDFRLECLEINVQPAMVSDPCRERAYFWRDLLETHRKGHL
uniref:carboxylesterase n=1 Tax=Anopheles epiroticus TaxID=199890 RepID=A0A182PTX2_9DIPT